MEELRDSGLGCSGVEGRGSRVEVCGWRVEGGGSRVES
jgi:hypothetical protein